MEGDLGGLDDSTTLFATFAPLREGRPCNLSRAKHQGTQCEEKECILKKTTPTAEEFSPRRVIREKARVK